MSEHIDHNSTDVWASFNRTHIQFLDGVDDGFDGLIDLLFCTYLRFYLESHLLILSFCISAITL
jgi:hypothetical protein